MPSRECKDCEKTVEVKKVIEEGPLFNVFEIVCVECGCVIENGVHDDHSGIQPLEEPDLPPINRV